MKLVSLQSITVVTNTAIATITTPVVAVTTQSQIACGGDESNHEFVSFVDHKMNVVEYLWLIAF